jgi:hypothetical protein
VLKKLHSLKNQWPNKEMGKWTEHKLKWSNKKKKNHTKKCWTSLTIKEMQIKSMLGFHLTPVRMTTIKNTNNN